MLLQLVSNSRTMRMLMDAWKLSLSLLTTPNNKLPPRRRLGAADWGTSLLPCNPRWLPISLFSVPTLGRVSSDTFFLHEHVCCHACLWWHSSHLTFLFAFWKCHTRLSLETLHLLFSSSRMILHQFAAWIGHHSTGHSSSVTSLWRPSDNLSMGSPPIHRCVTSQHVVFIVSLQLSLRQCLQDNLLSLKNVSTKTLGHFILALVLAPSFKRRLSMEWMANKSTLIRLMEDEWLCHGYQ